MQASTRFILLGLALSAACTPAPEDAPSPPQAVRVQEVRVGPIAEGRTHLAEVAPAQTVQILAQVPGTVGELGPREGAAVPRGTPLLRLDAPDIAARQARVEAERRRAERERDFLCTQLDTDRALVAAGDLPGVQLDRSEKACATAELAADAAVAAEREAAVTRSRTAEHAPFDGQVLSYLVDVGQTVMPGTPLARYGSDARQLRLRMVASDLDGIVRGTRAATPIGDGRVVEIGAQAQGPGRLVDVYVGLDDEPGLRVGETLEATLVVDEAEQASAVPEEAIGRDDAGAFVLLQEDTRLQRVDVTTGPRSQGWVAVEPTLPEGARVVTGAVASLDLDRPVLAVTP